MHTVRSTVLAAPLLALGLSAGAAVPGVEGVAQPAQIRCNTQAGGGAVNAVHADKIVFKIIGPLQAQVPGDQMALDALPRNTELDIKVLDDPHKVADLRAKVLTFLGAAPSAANRLQVDVGQVLYAMVCPVKPFTPPAD